jgi:hypothetical protein
MKLSFPASLTRLALLVLASAFLLGAAKSTGWETLHLRFHAGHFYRATSELNAPQDNTFGQYGMDRLFDNSLQTCWAEGVKGPGIGETLYLAVDEGTRFLEIANGYQKSPALYRANSRLKTIQAAVFVGINLPGEVTELFTKYHVRKFPSFQTLSLSDTTGFQKVPLPFDWKALRAFKDRALAQFTAEQNIAKESFRPDVRYILQLRIMDVYKGDKYNDTCISEIKAESPKQGFAVKKIYTNKAENTIFMDTETAAEIVLDSDKDAVFQIVALSPDKQWVIVIKMPAKIGSSRVETTYLLYNTRLKKRVDPKLLGPDVGAMYDFNRVGDATYLGYYNNKTMSIESVDLQQVYKKLLDRK